MRQNTDVKVAVFDTKPYDKEFLLNQNSDFGFQLTFFPYHLTESTVSLCQGFDAVCVFVNDSLNANVVEQLAKFEVSLVALRCAGYNNVDLKAAAGKVRVVNVPKYSPNGVAEHAVAMMLTLNRNTHRAFYRTRASNFSIDGLMGFDMHGKVAGIIGTGRIGRVACEILLGFGMRVLAYDPFPDREWASEKGVEFVDLMELIKTADIISLNCALTPDNTYMINKESISLMKKGVMIINTGRGKLVNTEDLLEGLRSGHIGYAGLDVYEEEAKYFFEDHSSSVIKDDALARLMTFPNVLVTSHQAFFTREALTNIATTTLTSIEDYFQERPLVTEVCPPKA